MKIRWFSLLLLTLLLLPGCTSRLPAPTLAGTDAAVQAAPPAASAAPSDPGALPAASARSPLDACSPERQAAALQPDVTLDWEALPINACYQLALELLPGAASYRGRAQITIQNLTDAAWPDIVLRLYPNSPSIYGGELAVLNALIDGIEVEPEIFLNDQTGLRLELKQPLQPAAVTLVELEFEGKTPRNLQGTTLAYGVFNTTTTPAAMILANWYPILSVRENGHWQAEPVIAIGDAVVSDVALYEVEITAPAGWQVVSTGTGIEVQAAANSSQWLVVSGPVREFMVTASPEYSLSEMELDGINLRHWGLPGGDSRWQESLQATADSAKLFEARFGEYPYNELDIVAANLELALGVEYPGLFLIQQGLYSPDEDQPFLLGLVVAHEAAHQWWYGLVGNDVLAHPWLDEALATYSSMLYQQQFQPLVYAGTSDYYAQNVADAEAQNSGLDTGMPVKDFIVEPGLYSRFVYQKGGLFFESLREKIGDQAFFAGLQQYYARSRFQIAHPADIFLAFETTCSCELDPYYEEWGLK